MRPLGRRYFPAAVLVLALGLAGCNDADGAPESDTGTPGFGETSAPTLAPSPSGSLPTAAPGGSAEPISPTAQAS